MGKFDMKVEKKIGKRTYEFTVQGENLYEAVMESKKLSFYDVHKCGCCGSDDLMLDAHLAQGKFKYVTVKCNNKDCRASLNFGSQTENPDVFYLKLRDKADGTGKEQDWRQPQNNQAAPQAPAPGMAPQAAPQAAPQQVAQQQVNNYAAQPQQPQQPRQ